jgi:hypothetical protein
MSAMPCYRQAGIVVAENPILQELLDYFRIAR